VHPSIQKALTFKLSVAIVCLSVLSACGNDGASNVDNDGVPIIDPQNIEDGKVVMGDITMTFSEFREKYCFAKGQNATCQEIGRQARLLNIRR
jgi:hypothetical protein